MGGTCRTAMPETSIGGMAMCGMGMHVSGMCQEMERSLRRCEMCGSCGLQRACATPLLCLCYDVACATPLLCLCYDVVCATPLLCLCYDVAIFIVHRSMWICVTVHVWGVEGSRSPPKHCVVAALQVVCNVTPQFCDDAVTLAAAPCPTLLHAPAAAAIRPAAQAAGYLSAFV
eukprot:361316-Chlamydomonas_euryale.AAC.1